MKISCKIAEDLLPLYLDESCSEDSRAALEGHLKECPSCRAAMARMQSGAAAGAVQGKKEAPELAAYAKKVRNHRIRTAVLTVLTTAAVSVILALSCLAAAKASPHIPEVEAGTYNLAAADLEAAAEETGQYVLFTNYTQISVTVRGKDGFRGTVVLHDAENSGDYIGIACVDEKADACTFTNLSSARRYIITCEDLDGTEVVISEGRTAGFWHNLKALLHELTGG